MLVTGPLFGRVELGAQRFFRNLLQARVDRRVNPESIAHRAIPAHGGNHLLADVINRVVLSARVLPVADS